MSKQQTTEKSVVLTQNSQEKVIIKIIEDHIVFSRICEGMFTILNASKPNVLMHELKVDYNGIDNALALMGIEDEKLIGKLHDTYYNCVSNGESDLLTVLELAKIIYLKWLNEIKNFFLTKKAA